MSIEDGASPLPELALRVVTRMGRALPQPLCAAFDTGGGTIGRSPDCTLVLADPGRLVSRRQARIEYRDGDWRVVALGTSNPLIVDGSELGPGSSAPLHSGTRIGIAEYEMLVEISGTDPSATEDPGAGDGSGAQRGFVNLIAEDFDPFSVQVDGPAPGADPAWSRAGGPARGAAPAPDDHPLAPKPSAFDDPFSSAGFDDASGPEVRGRMPPPARGAGGSMLAGSTDPFGASLDYQKRHDESVDALFGLGTSAQPLSGSDPLGAESPGGRVDDAALISGSEPLDPLEALARAGRSSPGGGTAGSGMAGSGMAGSGADGGGTVGDAAPALSGVMKLPEPIPLTRFDLPAGPASGGAGPPGRASAPIPEPTAPAGPVFSWDQVQADAPAGAPAVRRPSPGPGAAGRGVDPAITGPQTRAPASVGASDRRAVAAPPAAASLPRGVGGGVGGGGGGRGADIDALLAALLGGAGLLESPGQIGAQQARARAELTPAMMQRLGQLLLAAADGTVALLAARSTFKREMKAPVTLIGARENNPLKFAPDGRSAVRQLLADPPMRGFMRGPEAMRDPCQDLLAHQVAYVAGVRAAMQGLIHRFDPAQLEEQLSRKGALAAKLPGRRARLWEVFVECFDEISSEAQDDFERLFGDAFVSAYQAQLELLARDSERRS